VSAAAPSRWRTVLGDSLGMLAVVWAIPVAIVVVGLPIALLVLGARMAARMFWP